MKRVASTAQRLRELPFENRVCKSTTKPGCIDWEPTYEGLSLEEYVDFIAEVGLEVQVVSGEINRGTPRFRSKMIPPHPDVDTDRLPRFLELAHQKGIIVLSYYPMIFNKSLRAIHPEWLVKMLDDGRPEYGNRGWFCLNSPFRDWLAEYLCEWLDNLDLDGFYFDDTNIGSHSDIHHPWDPDGPRRPREYPGCHCVYCEKLFKEDTGLAIPRKVDFDSPDFRHFIVWRYKRWNESIKHIFRRIREKHADAILDLYYYGRPTTSWVRGHPLNPIGLEEIGCYCFTEMERSVRDTGYVAKISRATGVPFSLHRSSIQTLTLSEPNLYGRQPPYPEPFVITNHGLGAIANGGRAYSSFAFPLLHKDAVKYAFAEFKKRADYIEGETVKYVALHYSLQNRDFRPTELSKNAMKTDGQDYALEDAYGAYEMLNRSHLLVDFAFDQHLTYDYLVQYPVLFLSNGVCLSEEQCQEIRKYVSDGGTLIATYETSTMDELGRKRENFALADVLGVDYSLAAQLLESLHPYQVAPPKGIIYVPQDENLAKEFGYLICFAARESTVSLRPDADVEVLCTKSNLQLGPALKDFRPDMDYDSSEPAVTVNRFGKGRAIYIAADVGGGYVHNPHPPLMRFVASLVRRTKAPIEVEAPLAIEVTAAIRPSAELMIHLLNNPVPFIPPSVRYEDIPRYYYPTEVNPLRDIQIRFNDFKVQSAWLPLQERTLEVTGDPPTVVVPEVGLHEVLLARLA
jgi:hypothetical protein